MPTIHAEKLLRASVISRTIKLEDGLIISTDLKIMTVERAEHHFTGSLVIQIDDALMEQIESTSKYSGTVEINGDNTVRYINAKTVFGYVSGNIGIWDEIDHYDRWRDVAMECAEPLTESRGNMVWSADDVHRLARSSPSGLIRFETNHNIRDRPVLVRDGSSADWFGCFMGYVKDGRYHPAATLPEWMN